MQIRSNFSINFILLQNQNFPHLLNFYEPFINPSITHDPSHKIKQMCKIVFYVFFISLCAMKNLKNDQCLSGQIRKMTIKQNINVLKNVCKLIVKLDHLENVLRNRLRIPINLFLGATSHHKCIFRRKLDFFFDFLRGEIMVFNDCTTSIILTVSCKLEWIVWQWELI